MKNLNQLENRLSKYSLKNEEISSLKGGFGVKGGNTGTIQEGGGLLPPTANFMHMSFATAINS